MNDNNVYNNHLFTKYYIFGALFQTIWSIAVLGFTVFLVLYFQNYWVLFSLVLLFLHPYHLIGRDFKPGDEKEDLRKKYGTNNPPQ